VYLETSANCIRIRGESIRTPLDPPIFWLDSIRILKSLKIQALAASDYNNTEPLFVNVKGAQESIPRDQFRQAVCVAWRAGTTTAFLLDS
jgi:hypothetical protein